MQTMETQTRFSLDRALTAWRQEVGAQPGLSPDQARELEIHLIECIDDLKRRGLREEEAFWVACRRLGPGAEIAAEFVKAEPSRLWRERVYWMAVGVLASFLWHSVFAIGANVLGNTLRRSGINPGMWWNQGLYLVSYSALAWLAFIIARGRMPKPIQFLIDRLGSPRRLAWGLCALIAVGLGFSWISMWLYSRSHASSVGTGQIDIWPSLLMTVAWPALMAFVVIRLAPRTDVESGSGTALR